MSAPLLLVLLVALQSAATNAPGEACQAAEYRQFDFWIGEWDVFAPGGTRAGGNVIARDFDGCVIRETWSGTRGLNGSSFNIFDPLGRKWHQTWVDNSGMLLQLSGEFRDGAMRLSGRAVSAAGRSMNRITWTPNRDGTVRQLWESSGDEGKTWQVQFDGLYRRRAGQE